MYELGLLGGELSPRVVVQVGCDHDEEVAGLGVERHRVIHILHQGGSSPNKGDKGGQQGGQGDAGP